MQEPRSTKEGAEEEGGWGRNMRIENLLGDPKFVKDTLQYVEKTGRFNFV